MDARQAAALTGPQLRELGEAVSDAFELAALVGALYYRLDKPEWTLPDSDNYPDRIRLLLVHAKREGWLHELIEALREERPGNVKLKNCVAELDRGARFNSSRRLQVLDSSNFDLGPLRKAVVGAMMESASRVLGLGFTYPDGVFLDKFAGWLGSHLGQTQYKPKMNLLPEIGNIAKHVRDITRYRSELETTSVICEVHAVGVPSDTLSAFWRGVCDELDSPDSYLVLLISGGNDAVFPPGITALPSPVFDIVDIDIWTHEMVGLAGWRSELAGAWTQLLHEKSHYDGRLEVRYVYEAMDESIKMAMLHTDQFHRQLEERCHANKTPARRLDEVRPARAAAGEPGDRETRGRSSPRD